MKLHRLILLLPVLLILLGLTPAAAQRVGPPLSETARVVTPYTLKVEELPAGARQAGLISEFTNEDLAAGDPEYAALILRHSRLTEVRQTILRAVPGNTVLTIALFRDTEGAWGDALDSTFPEGVTPQRTLPGPEVGERSVLFRYQRASSPGGEATLLVFQRDRLEIGIFLNGTNGAREGDLAWALELARLVDAKVIADPPGPVTAAQLAALDTSPAALVRGAVQILLAGFFQPLEAYTLLREAWDGAAAALRRAGVTGVPAAPLFPPDQEAAIALHVERFPLLQQLAQGRLTDTRLAQAALPALADARDDCHTGYLSAEAWRATRGTLTGEPSVAFGVGFALDPPLRVVAVTPGGPAQAAGLRRGQVIVQINERVLDGLSVTQARALLDRREGVPNRFVVRNPSGRVEEVTVAPARFSLPVLESAILPSNVGLISFYSFPTSDQLLRRIRETLTDFEARGVTGWIIDLRNNGGGLDPTAIASLFVERGKLYGIIPREGQPIYRQATGETLPFQRPLVFLVGPGSASAAEILPGALQARERALLVGETTAGCVGSTRFIGLLDGSVLQITATEGVIGPNDIRLNGLGVPPDITVAPPTIEDEEAGRDPQLEAALRALAALVAAAP